MLGANDILDAINRLLVNRWKDRVVYCNQIPQNFDRESFAIFEEKYRMEDGGVDCVEVTATYTLIGFLPRDSHGNADRLALGELRQELLGLFRGGRLFAADRALPVECAASVERDTVFVDLTLQFYDDREPPKDGKKMEQIYIRQDTR